ncbi:MAG: hypothetical protein ACXAC7_04980 [Candidatus Hodarchaeales archaeon]|jgi:hypothetical protein
MPRNFSFSYHILGPLIASILLIFFLFLLQPLLYLEDVFQDSLQSLILFMFLWIGLIAFSYYMPSIDLTEQTNDSTKTIKENDS